MPELLVLTTLTVSFMQEEIAKLLCFETSSQPTGTLTSLQDYASRMKAGQRNIYYICAPRYSPNLASMFHLHISLYVNIYIILSQK